MKQIIINTLVTVVNIIVILYAPLIRISQKNEMASDVVGYLLISIISFCFLFFLAQLLRCLVLKKNKIIPIIFILINIIVPPTILIISMNLMK